MTGSDVVIPGGDGWPDTPAYAVMPGGATRGVVVIHEIFGRQPEIDRVVSRFGAAGYAAVGPDLFSAPSRFTCIRHTMRAMSTGDGPAVRHAAGVRQWLCDQTGIGRRSVGIIGFCFGGGFALAVGRGWGAISTNYGVVPSNPEVLRNLGPTIGCYGGRDVNFRGLARTLEQRLGDARVPVESHLFPDVGHSFLTDAEPGILNWLTWPLMHIEYKKDTADAAWEKIFGFFDRHIPVSRPAVSPTAAASPDR